MTDPAACSQCAGSGGVPVTEADFDPLADSCQIAGAGGGAFGVIASRIARRSSVRRFQGLAFCQACRGEPSPVPNPFRIPKLCAGAGFFLGLTLLGSPVSFLLYAASFISLRRGLRAFRDRPRAGSIYQILEATGTLTLAVLGHGALLLVMGGVVV